MNAPAWATATRELRFDLTIVGLLRSQRGWASSRSPQLSAIRGSFASFSHIFPTRRWSVANSMPSRRLNDVRAVLLKRFNITHSAVRPCRAISPQGSRYLLPRIPMEGLRSRVPSLSGFPLSIGRSPFYCSLHDPLAAPQPRSIEQHLRGPAMDVALADKIAH